MKKIFAAALFFCVLSGLFSQEYGRGTVLDNGRYEGLPRKARQISRAYTALPSSVSLKAYAPTPGSQGAYGTCTAWATAYAARTIAESLALHRTSRARTNANVFSPAFVYKNISDDPACMTGTFIGDALDLMRHTGVPKMAAAEKTMDFAAVPLGLFTNERKYTIAGYATLYFNRTSEGEVSKTAVVKKSLSEGKPVVVGIICPDSFANPGKEVWYPPESPDSPAGGHAICVVGYDDGKYGGAFEIQNSWDTNWGNDGYIWIPYEVFERFAYHGYELIDNLAAYGEFSEYSGNVQIEVRGSGGGMPVRFRDGYYQTVNAYPSGTRFRYLLGNDEPAYVYAFAADDSANKTTMIFPYPGQNVSPVLDYSENLIPFPSENTWIELDNITGTDYLVVLYSKEAVDIEAVRRRFESARGSFPERVAGAVGDDFIPYNRAEYETDAMKFSARSANNRAVFGLLLAVKHR
ncbi:MAG: C39 family peptidase [Treponema sp.]|jgi:hypothetical protein|nr:C39 family peptidase [Treponema sp.]